MDVEKDDAAKEVVGPRVRDGQHGKRVVGARRECVHVAVSQPPDRHVAFATG
ncbi:hypothetical protein [Mycolicibacterium sp. XJ1904]